MSDDYVKFIRMAEHLIEKNGEGVLGFITNHSWLDNPTFLDMRSHLRETFDGIFVLDLHGNAKKKEVSPDGSPDQNVFDIQQGVAVIVAVKRRAAGAKVGSLAPVYHAELWGSRTGKYEALWAASPGSLNGRDVSPNAAPWRFKPTDQPSKQSIAKDFRWLTFSRRNGRPAPGIVTTHDGFAISWSPGEAIEKVSHLLATSTEAEARQRFALCRTTQWSYANAKRDLPRTNWQANVLPIAYRPFDTRFTIFSSHVAVHRRERLSTHLLSPNLAMQTSRQQKSPGEYAQVFAHSGIAESGLVSNKSAEIGSSFPLYLYPTGAEQTDAFASKHRTLNIDPKLYAAICAAARIDPADQAGPDDDFSAATGDARPSEVKVFDYIYGVLHSPDYRRTFAEFLKIDFPRIPYPPSPGIFRHVSEKGEQLRRLHLMEPAAIGDTLYPYKGDGDDIVASGIPKFEDSRVHINKDQFFDAVPPVAWSFPIGGYLPAQKWLKDRRGRSLSWDDIGHYQRIVKILTETDRIMREIALPLD